MASSSASRAAARSECIASRYSLNSLARLSDRLSRARLIDRWVGKIRRCCRRRYMSTVWLWIAVDKWTNLTLPSRCRSGSVAIAMVAALWPRIREVVAAAEGSICSHCIASALTLPGQVVAMATFGLSRSDDLEMADGACDHCGRRGRVMRLRRAYRAKCVRCSRPIESSDEVQVVGPDLFHATCGRVLDSQELIRASRTLQRNSRRLIDESWRTLTDGPPSG